MERLTDEDNEAIWGPRPSDEELNEALQWNRDETIRRLDLVLADCILPMQLAHKLGLSSSAGEEVILDDRLVVIDLGEAGKFLPTWQFDDFRGEGSSEMSLNPVISELWEVAGARKSALHFAQFMSMPWRATNKTPLQLATEQNQDELTEIKHILKYPFMG